MPSLSEAMEHATSGLYRAGDALEEILRIVGRWLPRRRMAQPYDGLVKGLLQLAAIVAIDRVAGHPPVLQILFLAPVWIAFETADLGVAAVLAVVVVPVTTIFSKTPEWGPLWDVVVRSAVMASLVAIMVFHSRRYRTTHETSRRDALTGALNRRGFEDAAREAIDVSLSEHRALSLAVIDLDNFKELNDLKGHAFGDAILSTLVRVLKGAFIGATIGRTGGDEFVIVDGTRTAKEVRVALDEALNRFTDATLIMGRRSTFTVGVAQLGAGGMRYESLLEAADRDMYRGKVERYSLVGSSSFV